MIGFAQGGRGEIGDADVFPGNALRDEEIADGLCGLVHLRGSVGDLLAARRDGGGPEREIGFDVLLGVTFHRDGVMRLDEIVEWAGQNNGAKGQAQGEDESGHAKTAGTSWRGSGHI